LIVHQFSGTSTPHNICLELSGQTYLHGHYGIYCSYQLDQCHQHLCWKRHTIDDDLMYHVFIMCMMLPLDGHLRFITEAIYAWSTKGHAGDQMQSLGLFTARAGTH
jgi:hypothetical protein